MSQGQEQPVVVEPLHQGEGGPQTRGRPPTHEETSRRRPIVARGRGRSGQGNAGDGGNARQPVDADVEQIEAHGGSRRRGSPDPNADQGAGGVAGDPRREYSRQQSVIRRQKANIKAFKFDELQMYVMPLNVGYPGPLPTFSEEVLNACGPDEVPLRDICAVTFIETNYSMTQYWLADPGFFTGLGQKITLMRNNDDLLQTHVFVLGTIAFVNSPSTMLEYDAAYFRQWIQDATPKSREKLFDSWAAQAASGIALKEKKENKSVAASIVMMLSAATEFISKQFGLNSQAQGTGVTQKVSKHKVQVHSYLKIPINCNVCQEKLLRAGIPNGMPDPYDPRNLLVWFQIPEVWVVYALHWTGDFRYAYDHAVIQDWTKDGVNRMVAVEKNDAKAHIVLSISSVMQCLYLILRTAHFQAGRFPPHEDIHSSITQVARSLFIEWKGLLWSDVKSSSLTKIEFSFADKCTPWMTTEPAIMDWVARREALSKDGRRRGQGQGRGGSRGRGRGGGRGAGRGEQKANKEKDDGGSRKRPREEDREPSS